jgi:hypothetical protein
MRGEQERPRLSSFLFRNRHVNWITVFGTHEPLLDLLIPKQEYRVRTLRL